MRLRCELPLGLPGADNEVIGKAAQAAHVQQDDIAGLLAAGQIHGAAGYLNRFQASLSPDMSFQRIITQPGAFDRLCYN